jgi:hypothetical protein
MAKTFLIVSLSLVLGACTTSRLRPLVLKGQDLHLSLVPRPLDRANHGVPRGVRDNPHFSTDVEVVEAIARYASQGQLDGDGIRAALYALYQCDREVGFYALEAASTGDADRLEGSLGRIWAHNVDQGIARVHRGGQVLVVVWNDGASPACWQAVNGGLVDRLTSR